MKSLLSQFVFGNETFGLNLGSHPYLSVFGLEIYLYAIVIVFGMCMAILTAGLYFKKRGYDPYDITIYALVVIPIGVLGARAYVYIFPWHGHSMDWSTFFSEFRNGGLGIYGGVIMGYLAALVCSKIKKQDFRIVCDAIMPGLFLAQSIGRWGNYFNQEAYGKLIEGLAPPSTESLLPHFNGYAVWIPNGNQGTGWYQATFFYESMCTLLGFIICVAVLTRSKRYKLGWCSAFYGIYYGIVRLVIEGMRSDSLFLFVGNTETDIKISQLVSVFAIIFGVLTLGKIYRKEIHSLYKKMFRDDLDEIAKSRWILLAASIVLLGVGVTMCVLCGTTKSANGGKGGETFLIAGVVLIAVSIYAGLGVWSLFDRMKVYCNECRSLAVNSDKWQSGKERSLTQVVCYSVIMGALLCFGLFSLVKWGIVDRISNGTVLFVACAACILAIGLAKLMPAVKSLRKEGEPEQGIGQTDCQCDNSRTVKLNRFLLFVFPPKVYLDYGVENLKPYVDEKAQEKKAKRKSKKDNI